MKLWKFGQLVIFNMMMTGKSSKLNQKDQQGAQK